MMIVFKRLAKIRRQSKDLLSLCTLVLSHYAVVPGGTSNSYGHVHWDLGAVIKIFPTP